MPMHDPPSGRCSTNKHMKKITFVIWLCSLLQLSAQAPAKKPGRPADDGQRYILFLHNKFIEESGPEASHPEYGRTEYAETVQAFKQEGFTVMSEVRKKDTDVKEYALKVKGQIDSLLASGVAPSRITVIGTSKGGYISLYVSGLAKNKDLNYVIIGCCPNEEPAAVPELGGYGNLLFIYEKSDVIAGSCRKLKNAAGNKIGRFKEIELNTGLKHGFLYKPLKEWVGPSVAWARQQD